MTPLPFEIAPEYLLLSASAIWVVCGAAVGLRAPPLVRIEAGLLFVTLGVAGGGAGLSVFLPASQSGTVLAVAIAIFGALPLLASAYLIVLFPDRMVRRSRTRS